MAEHTAIEWCDHTFNPWEGCQKVGPGCDNCYAEARDQRFTGGRHWGSGAPRRRTSPSNWHQPVRWNLRAATEGRRARVFCASLADVFDNAVPPEWREDLFRLIASTPHLDWLLLTKRPGNVAAMLPFGWGAGWHNVWLGCTVVNQAEADRDIPKLLSIPAAVRFLSMEPLLGPVDLTAIPRTRAEGFMRPLDGRFNRIHWAIVGGESGQNARPMHPDWARSIRDQCQAAGVPFLFKQWGEWAPISQIDEADADELYLPAPEDNPEATRRCRVASSCLHIDGSSFPIGMANGFHTVPLGAFAGPSPMSMFCIGKRAAGRLLDGREWTEFPDAGTMVTP